VAAGFLAPWQPRVFWTMLLPLLVLLLVLGGFHPWRSLCPLAALGELGQRLGGPSLRKVPAWLERAHLVVPFVVLAALLVVRLVVTNGDGPWLSVLLVGLAVAAVAANRIYTGKTWCNFFCPVGVVERIYTDPAPLVPARNSQCARCTACKRSCPDIDQENNYWRELQASGRRLVTYAFPGVVLAFYAYFWLRAGDWEAYFDGRWTAQPATRELLLGPGFFFAPGVPALAAATATLAGFALASFAVFHGAETATRGLSAQPERHRHRMLSLAAFAAFSLFYVFAGAPTLRKIPYGTRTFAFIAPAVAVLVLARRWDRSREVYGRERLAARLVRHWPFPGAPPADPLEAYTRVQAGVEARDQLLSGYVQTLREVLADGQLDESEWRLLGEIERQFGITPRERERALASLSEEERRLVASGRVATVEERLQAETYRAALTEALLRSAPDSEVEALRRSFGLGVQDHQAILERLRRGQGPLLERAHGELAEARSRHADRVAFAVAPPAGESGEMLAFLLARAEEAALGRLYGLLAVVGDGPAVEALRPGLGSGEPAARAAALARLRAACPSGLELVDAIEPLLAAPAAPGHDADRLRRLARLATDADPFVRAAAVWGLLASGDPSAEAALVAGRADGDPLVREAAEAPRPGPGSTFSGRPRIVRMQSLRRVPLFAELEPGDLLELAELAREEEVAPEASLCEEGRPDSGDVFIVLGGRATVTVRGGDGDREIAQVGPGDVVGELALLDGSPRSATVRAAGGPLRVLRIPAGAFRDRLLPRGRVARSLLLTLTRRLRALSNRLAGG
jgi:hypothetical protein